MAGAAARLSSSFVGTSGTSRTVFACAVVIALGVAQTTGCGSSEETPAAPAPPPAAPPPADAEPPPQVDAGPPLDVPASLVSALSSKPYVEESCTKTTYDGWPNEAQRCTYKNGLVVVVADPPAERVARWIVEASRLIPALDALHERDRASWEKGLLVIAAHTLGQSSRIFPLVGQIWENGTVYRFERGVTKTCSSGCYCRVNSVSRAQWCKYQDRVLGKGDEQTCLATMGATTSTLTEPWLAQCLANHVASWSSDANEHYRAMAWNANLTLSTQFPDPGTASGADVVTALQKAYPGG